MLVTGMASLHTNSLSMIIVSRNVANLVLMVGDYAAFGKRPDVIVAAIYSILLVGAVAAAWHQNNFRFTNDGLVWMVTNCICTSAYILCMKHFISTAATGTQTATPPATKLTMFGIIFVNNALCIVLLLPAAYAMGEISLFFATKAIHTAEYATKTIVAGLVCFLFNFALLNCVEQSTHHHPNVSRRWSKSSSFHHRTTPQKTATSKSIMYT
jgi:hypothetical protein